MEFATGAMSTLIPKLGMLLVEEYNLQKGLKKGINGLRKELSIIEAALEKVSDVPLDQLNPSVKIWANDVRELSYTIEDSLDSFMVRVEGLEPDKPHTFFRFIKKTCKKVRNLKIRREIASDIEDVKIQVKEVKERYDRYKGVFNNSSARIEVDPRLLAMYSKVSDLVGIEEAMDELMKLLFDQNDASNNNLKTVSVVGFGGLGKTTLAKGIYDKLYNKFICGGFVPVGRNPDVKKVLRDILHELDKQKYMNITASQMDVRQLMDEVRGFLGNKRYIIVIDDIWDIPTWEVIKSALVQGNSESIIITTTRNVEVAEKVGDIYNMKPLSDVDSKLLFYKRTFCGGGVNSANQPAEVINKILKKCGGVPLALITIASLLDGKPSEDWSNVYDGIGFGHEENEVLHNTRKILSYSYYDLPSNLKTCLLYLSMFPEDSFIEKTSLIWRWATEGFVLDREGIGCFEQGEMYFNTLVNKCMIQWIEPKKYGGNTSGCRVHDMVLDLIRTISKDVNFVKIDGMEQHNTSFRGDGTHRVRRMALHETSTEHNSSIAMEHMRSFSATMCDHTKMPLLLSFKVLRVLVIVDCVLLKGHGLEHLGKLLQLRYLGVVNTSVKLPEGIGHDLKFLEILDVRGGFIRELPSSIGELTNLRCLWADGDTIMKGKVGKLTCLEDLQLNSVEKCPNFFTELGKLANLRVLKIHFDEWEEITCKALADSLCNLHKIQSLTIFREGANNIMALYNRKLHVRVGSLEELAPSSRLRLFSLYSIIIPKMPSWINSLRVPLLSELWLYVEVVEAQDLQALGRLSSLLVLMLESVEKKRISYTFGNDEFPKLYCLMTNIEITIGQGALPRLEVLSYSVSAGKKDSLVPWNNSCPLLKEVTCRLDCADSGNKEVEAAEEALSNAADKSHLHACILGLDIERENYDMKASNFTDRLELILHCLDRPDEQGSNIYEDELVDMIKTLEILLRDAVEPRVGRYGEKEIHGFITTFKSLLHDFGQEFLTARNSWYQGEEEADNVDHQEGTSQP